MIEGFDAWKTTEPVSYWDEEPPPPCMRCHGRIQGPTAPFCANCRQVLDDQIAAGFNPYAKEKTMDVSEFLTSNSALLKKEDIGNHRPLCVISDIETTEFDGERKLVLRFQGKDKGMALNKTNTAILAEAYGKETNGWVGQQVEVWVDPYVTFGGRVVGGLKVTPRSPAIPQPQPAPAQPAGPPPAQPQSAQHDDSDSIPF